MRLTLTDTYDRKLMTFEVVLEGPADTYYGEKPLPDWMKPEPHYQLGTEAGRKRFMEKLVGFFETREKQRVCEHTNSEQTRLMFELGPICQYDRDYFACGYNNGGDWKAWIKLEPMMLVLAFHTEWPEVDFYDFSHKQLDAFRALKWKAPNPVTVLDLLVREVVA